MYSRVRWIQRYLDGLCLNIRKYGSRKAFVKLTSEGLRTIVYCCIRKMVNANMATLKWRHAARFWKSCVDSYNKLNK